MAVYDDDESDDNDGDSDSDDGEYDDEFVYISAVPDALGRRVNQSQQERIHL